MVLQPVRVLDLAHNLLTSEGIEALGDVTHVVRARFDEVKARYEIDTCRSRARVPR